MVLNHKITFHFSLYLIFLPSSPGVTSLISRVSSTFLVAIISPARPCLREKYNIRHRADSSGPMTGSRFETPVMGPEGEMVGVLGTFGSMGGA